MIPALDVWLSRESADVLVGRAHFNLRRGSISCTFSYDDAYLAREDAFPVDPALPLKSASYTTRGLPGAFRDSAPDRWGRHLVARLEVLDARQAERAPRTLDEVGYLLGVHDVTRQGALRFSAAGSTVMLSDSDPVPRIVTLPALIGASNDIALGHAGASQIKELLDAGSGSLGGARPKAAVVDGDRLIMAKFSHPGDEWDVMAWEKTALDMASQAGLPTPQARLVRIGDQSALLLARFDRKDAQADGGRIPYMSAMTLLSAQDGEQRDYVEVAEALPQHVGEIGETLESLFVRVVFSIAIHNTDDHLRNMGLLRDNRGWRLSPVFDVNPNPSLSSRRVTSIYGETGESEASALDQATSSFGITRDRAQHLVAGVLNSVVNWVGLARANGCAESEIKMFSPVFEGRFAALRTAFGV